MEKYSPQDFVNKVNELTPVDKDSEDGRMKELSVRRLRDLQSKGLISEPERDGRNVFYTDVHLNEVVSLRKLFQDGMSESVIQKMKSGSENLINTVINTSSYLSSSSLQKPENQCSSLESATSLSENSSIFDVLKSIAPQDNVMDKYQDVKLQAVSRALSSQSSIGNGSVPEHINNKNVYLNNYLVEQVTCKVECSYDLGNEVKLSVQQGKKLTPLEKAEVIKKFNQIINNL